MPKSKKKTQQKSSTFILPILSIMIIVIAFMLYQHYFPATPNPVMVSTADNEHPNTNNTCTDFDATVGMVKDTSLKAYIIDENERNDGNASAMAVSWQRKGTEPDLTYNSERSSELYVKTKTVDQVKNILSTELAPYFTGNGYALSELNTRSYTVDYLAYPDRARVGYIKGDTFYSFSIDMSQYKVVNNKQVDLPKDTVGIYIQCASIEPELDQLYTDLLRKPENWVENPKEQPKSLSIWKNMDNLVMVETGGAASWVTKTNGEWESLAWGQDNPDCDVIEAKRVGKGFACNRKAKDGSYKASTVDY